MNSENALYRTTADVTVLKVAAGADGSGEILARAVAAAKDGTAKKALILAPSSSAAQALQDRAAEMLGGDGEALRIATPREVALELLDCDDAYAAIGRRAHVLAGYEVSFLNEDLGVLGTKGRRIRELVKFLERGWSEMREDDQDWLVTGEEMAFERHLKERLGLLEALHPAEVEAACVRYLAASPDAIDHARYDHIYVCDLRSIGRSSQILACMLAGSSLVVSWDTAGALKGEDPYAYDAGLDELLGANAQARVVELAQSHTSRCAGEVVERLLAERAERGSCPAARLDQDAPEGSFETIDAGMLGDEMAAIAQSVVARLDVGVDPSSVFVAVPNDAWARRVRTALTQAGVACSAIEERQALSCDVRDVDKSRAARAFTAIALAADPDSAIAWRCWCGFGDYLTHAGVFSDLYESALRNGRGLLVELEEYVEANEGAQVAERYRSGREFIEESAGLFGNDLVAAACRAVDGAADVPPALASLIGEVEGGEDARVLYKRARRALMSPVFGKGRVRVGSWERLLGIEAHTIVFSGMVNGLVPERAYFDLTQLSLDGRAKMHEKLIVRLLAAVCHATSDVVCTTFSKAGLVDAETLKLDSERIQLVDGRRVCRISPSLCIGLMQG